MNQTGNSQTGNSQTGHSLTGNSNSIALVLPPREAFGPSRAGAVGLKVQRFAKGAADGGEPPCARSFSPRAIPRRCSTMSP